MNSYKTKHLRLNFISKNILLKFDFLIIGYKIRVKSQGRQV